MSDQSTVKLTIALLDQGDGGEELDQRTRRLLHELRDLDVVETVSLVSTSDVPTGSKAVGAVLLGMLHAWFKADGLKSIWGVLQDHLNNKPVILEVEANGKKIKISANSREELLAAAEMAEEFVRLSGR